MNIHLFVSMQAKAFSRDVNGHIDEKSKWSVEFSLTYT